MKEQYQLLCLLKKDMGPYNLFWLSAVFLGLWALSTKFPYYFKMTAFFLGSGFITILALPFLFLRPRDYRNALLPAAGCRSLARMIGVTMEVRGLENVKKNHGSVVLINHQSAIDLLGLAYLWPVIGRSTVISKIEVLYIPFFGVAAYLWGTLFINRRNLTNSVQVLSKEAKAINQQNAKLLIFPEGSRNGEEILLPFKKGAFHIALDTRCTIQPVVISKYYFIDSKLKIFNRGHAIIHILPEVLTTDFCKDRMQDLMDHCRDLMQTEFRQLSREVLEVRKAGEGSVGGL